MAENGLDLLGQDLAEDIRPAVVIDDSDSVARRRRARARRGRFERKRGEKIDPGITVEGFRDTQDFRLLERIGDMAAKAQERVPAAATVAARRPTQSSISRG